MDDRIVVPASNNPKLFLSVDNFHGRWFVEGHNDGQGGSRTIATVAREKHIFLPITQCLFLHAADRERVNLDNG